MTHFQRAAFGLGFLFFLDRIGIAMHLMPYHPRLTAKKIVEHQG